MQQKNRIIILHKEKFVGDGMSRECYIHPDNKDQCIKIPHKSPSSRRSMKREVSYFKRLKKRKKSFLMVSSYLYQVETSKGIGEVFELIRDHDGSISRSMKHYLSLGDENIKQTILEMVEVLRQYLIKEYILFSDLRTDNILLQKISHTESQLIIIDGIGDNNQIPFLEYIPILGLKRQIKKWEKLRNELIKEFSCDPDKIKRFNE